MSTKSNLAIKDIGARFRSARALVADLNRKSFCERHSINRYTMQSWENGLHVSKGKNVEKFIAALAKEGVHCSAEWLIDGIGDPAKPIELIQKRFSENNTKAADEPSPSHARAIEKMIEAYGGTTKAIALRVPDDAMAPKFLCGDMVVACAIAQPQGDHPKYCVVELGPERLMIRKVFTIKNGLLLTALDERMPSLELKSASKVYEIIWHLIAQ